MASPQPHSLKKEFHHITSYYKVVKKGELHCSAYSYKPVSQAFKHDISF